MLCVLMQSVFACYFGYIIKNSVFQNLIWCVATSMIVVCFIILILGFVQHATNASVSGNICVISTKHEVLILFHCLFVAISIQMTSLSCCGIVSMMRSWAKICTALLVKSMSAAANRRCVHISSMPGRLVAWQAVSDWVRIIQMLTFYCGSIIFQLFLCYSSSGISISTNIKFASLSDF